MDERANKLLSAFEINGWQIVGSADVAGDWWFNDIIELAYTWRPVNTTIYITLLVDPMATNKKEIWAIGISLNIPLDKHHVYIEQITLNDIKRTDLDAFVRKINTIALNDKRQ